MAIIKYNSRTMQKHDSSANWKNQESTFVPLPGEIIVYDDLEKIKIGNGSTTLGALPFFLQSELDRKSDTSHGHYSLKITDIRNITDYIDKPYTLGEYCLQPFFSNINMPSSDWYSGINVAGWHNHPDTSSAPYQTWQLISGSSAYEVEKLYFRIGIGESWRSWKTVAFTDSDITGNANTATKLSTARTISLTGDTIGSGTFDGSNDLNISTSTYQGTPTTNFASQFKTDCFGSASNAYKISVIRSDSTISGYSWNYSPGIAWETGDTHAYLLVHYSEANAYIGAGSGNALGWVKQIAFLDSSISGNAATSTKATADAHGNVITDTYVTNLKLNNWVQLKSNLDNRSVSTTPNDYNGVFRIAGLKSNSAIGSPSSDIYSGVIGFRQWTDSSGGNAHEFALNDSGLYVRSGATTSWGSWEKFLTSRNFPAITYGTGTTGPSGAKAGDIYIRI